MVELDEVLLDEPSTGRLEPERLLLDELPLDELPLDELLLGELESASGFAKSSCKSSPFVSSFTIPGEYGLSSWFCPVGS